VAAQEEIEMKKLTALAVAAVAGMASTALAGGGPPQYLLVPMSSANEIAAFNPFDGSLINPTYIDLNPLEAGTPKHAHQVGNEIWVSDQIRDRIDRFSLTGSFLSSIGGNFAGSGLDNIKGMQVVGNEVWVTNAGTNNDAPGNAIVRIDASSGDILGNIPTNGSSFDIIRFNGENLVSFIGAATTRIDRYDDSGNLLGNFVSAGQFNFFQQMAPMDNGNLLVAAFSNLSGGFGNGVYEIDGSTGSPVGPVQGTLATGPRGVYELGNGNIMWTNGGGVQVTDPNTGITTTVLAGSAQYIDLVIIPTPGAAGILALAGLAAARRRR